MSDAEFAEDYAFALKDLKTNVKHIIVNLTEIAKENVAQGHIVVRCIEDRLREVRLLQGRRCVRGSEDGVERHVVSVTDLLSTPFPLAGWLLCARAQPLRALPLCLLCAPQVPRDQKLPLIYLIDSIVKNIKHKYVALFQPTIAATYLSVFRAVDGKTRASMRRVLDTWGEYFANNALMEIRRQVDELEAPASVPAAAPRMHAPPPQQHGYHGGPPPPGYPGYGGPPPPGYPGYGGPPPPQAYYPPQPIQVVQALMRKIDEHRRVVENVAARDPSNPDVQEQFRTMVELEQNLEEVVQVIQDGRGLTSLQVEVLKNGARGIAPEMLRDLDLLWPPAPMVDTRIQQQQQQRQQQQQQQQQQAPPRPAAPAPAPAPAQRPPSPPRERTIIMTNDAPSLAPDRLKKFDPRVLQGFARGKPHMCRSCGEHFATIDEMRKHADVEFQERRKRKKQTKSVASRAWFAPLEEWQKDPLASSAAEAPPSFFETQATAAASDEDEFAAVSGADAPSMPMDEARGTCTACGEKFKTFFDDDEEEWRFRDCVQVADAYVHASCRRRSLKRPLDGAAGDGDGSNKQARTE